MMDETQRKRANDAQDRRQQVQEYLTGFCRHCGGVWPAGEKGSLVPGPCLGCTTGTAGVNPCAP
jgi:hypothetical protein